MLPSINSLINDPPLEVTKKYYSQESGNGHQVPLQQQQQPQQQPQQLQQQQQPQPSSYSDPYSRSHHDRHYYPQETQQTSTFAPEQPYYQQAPQPQQYHQPQSQSHQQHRQQIQRPSTISTSLPVISSSYGGISSGSISSGGLQLLPGYPTHHNRSHSISQSTALYSNQPSSSSATGHGNLDSFRDNSSSGLGGTSSNSGGYFSNGPLLYPQSQPQQPDKLRSASSASANTGTITTAPIISSPPSSALVNASRNVSDDILSRDYYGPSLGPSSSNMELQNSKYETAEMKERRLQKEKEKRDQITNGITRLQKMVPKLNQQQVKKGKGGSDFSTGGSLKLKGKGLENIRKSRRSTGHGGKDADANAMPKRTSKAAILLSSAQYIKDLKKEIEELKLKINQYEERGKKLSSSQIKGRLKDIELYRGKLDEYEKYKQKHTNTTPEYISNKKADFSFIKSEFNPQSTLHNRNIPIASVGAAHLRMSSPLPSSSSYNKGSFQPPPHTHSQSSHPQSSQPSQPSQPPKTLQPSHPQPTHNQKLPPTLPPLLPPQQHRLGSTMYHINSTAADNSNAPSPSSQSSYPHNYSGYYPSQSSTSAATGANMYLNVPQQHSAQKLAQPLPQQQQEQLQQQYYASLVNLGNPLLRRPSGSIRPTGQLGSTNAPTQGYYGYYRDNTDDSTEKKGATSLSQYKI